MTDGRVATPNPKPEAGYYYRTDHFAFAKRGVPMLYIDGGEDLVEGGARPARKWRAITPKTAITGRRTNLTRTGTGRA